jgi:hypothetical protein
LPWIDLWGWDTINMLNGSGPGAITNNQRL